MGGGWGGGGGGGGGVEPHVKKMFKKSYFKTPPDIQKTFVLVQEGLPYTRFHCRFLLYNSCFAFFPSHCEANLWQQILAGGGTRSTQIPAHHDGDVASTRFASLVETVFYLQIWIFLDFGSVQAS